MGFCCVYKWATIAWDESFTWGNRKKSYEARSSKGGSFCTCTILMDWLTLLACQLVKGYFMPRGYRMVFIVQSYLQFLCRCFLRYFFCHMILLNTNNFSTDPFNPKMGPKQVPHFKVGVDLCVMAMKRLFHTHKISSFIIRYSLMSYQEDPYFMM